MMKSNSVPTLLRSILRPNPRRFLAVWYTLWLGYALKGFFVNWLVRQQPIRIAWMPVTGPAEGLYLLAEIAVVSAIVWQAWRFERANWRLAWLYEWYSLIELGLSAANPHLWTYAMNQMWGKPLTLFGATLMPGAAPVIWSDATASLVSHLGFIAFYAFMHHGLPLLVLSRVARQSVQGPVRRLRRLAPAGF